MANENNLVASPSGDKFRLVQKWSDNTCTSLEIVSKVDIQKEIDERAKGCTLRDLIARAEAGDMSVFTHEENFADVTDLPESDIDAIAMLKEQTKAINEYLAAHEKEEALKKEEPLLREKVKEETPVEEKKDEVK